jgi:hypothetical protein
MTTIKKDWRKDHLMGTSLEWRINTPAFLKEIFDNYPGQGGVLFQPANMFRELLAEVAARASQLNDPIMNALMVRLALYGIADPYDKENYNHEALTQVLNHPDYIKYKRKK